MPYVTAPRCFAGYPLSAIPDALIEALQASRDWQNKVRCISIRLQAFCELTEQSLIGLPDSQASTLIQAFVASLHSSWFQLDNTKTLVWHSLHQFRTALPIPLQPYFPCTRDKSKWPTSFRAEVERYDRTCLTTELAEFWTGWTAVGASGRLATMTLWQFWQQHGPERARQLHSATRNWYASSRQSRIGAVEPFSQYLARIPSFDFDDSIAVGRAIADFMPVYFRQRHASGVHLATLTSEWSRFADLLSKHLVGHVWAAPIPTIPLPRRRRVLNSQAHVRKTSEGHVVKTSLLTTIPLQLSDTQAKELLFRDIQQDFDYVLAWAQREVSEARSRRLLRVAAAGEVESLTPSRKRRLHETDTAAEREAHFARSSYALEQFGFSYLSDEPQQVEVETLLQSYCPLDLGLATPALLLAHAAVLVANHPVITTAFLEELQMYDAEGTQVGLVPTDAGWYLRGVKRRKGAKLAQQDILLTTETHQVVLDVIEMTAPMRRWLKDQGDPLWRRLFLALASMGCRPSQWRPSAEAFRQKAWLVHRMQSATKPSDTDLNCQGRLQGEGQAQRIASSFSLKRLRSSAAVLVYIGTGSVDAMAKALGHTTWRPKLLDRYLPKPIQEFFTERWIRLFQTGIICKALENSPLVLDVSGFESLADLDQFLENHALKCVPTHLEDADVANDTPPQENTRLVFGLDVDILTLLISTEAAVRDATSVPAGRAVRWARISERLVSFLESQTDEPLFTEMVKDAQRRADPRLVQDLIYG
ncbi:hypothetical protein ABE493_08305 [Stenotrophomonas terrae]|uniref:hypothetical protein n=1 Tax=Stenotrophomonas terrae TaxID=405446 RepID=UPI0032097DC2